MKNFSTHAFAYLPYSALGILLLLMVARLVWIDVNTHRISYDQRTLWYLPELSATFSCNSTWPSHTSTPDFDDQRQSALLSPGALTLLSWACRDGILRTSRLLLWNEWSLRITVSMLALCVRLFTGTWLPAAFLATALLSRGNLRHPLGHLGWDGVMMALISAFMLLLAAYLLTRRRTYLLLMVPFAALATSLDGSAVALFLPWFLLVLLRYRKRSTSPSLHPHSSPSTQSKTSALALYSDAALLCCGVLALVATISWPMAASFLLPWDGTTTPTTGFAWFGDLLQRLDGYLIMALITIIFYLALPMSWQPSRHKPLGEWIFFFVLTMVTMGATALIWDIMEQSILAPAHAFPHRVFLRWFEACCLTAGALGLWGLCSQTLSLMRRIF